MSMEPGETFEDDDGDVGLEPDDEVFEQYARDLRALAGEE